MLKTKSYRTVKYLRLSHADENAVESDSILNQMKLIDDFIATRPELEAVSERIDDGWTGTNYDRPSFKAMISDIEAGKIDCVVCKDLSRFGRDYIDTGRYLRQFFPQHGIRFIAINDNVDTLKDRCDDISISFKNIINDAYAHDISKKTRSALAVKRKNGDYVGACPVYGYMKSADNKNQLVVDETAADIVRDIFRMKIEGVSAAKIADILNGMGVLSPIEYKKQNGLPYPKGGYADIANAKWSATTVIRILKDEIYTGVLIQGKQTTGNHKIKKRTVKSADEWERTEQAHDAIIRKQDFELVQRIIRLDTRISPQGKEVYLFSGILICGCCGGRMTRKVNSNQGNTRVYYYCRTGKRNGCETPVMLKEADLIDCVLQTTKAYVNNVISFDELLKRMSAKNINRSLVTKVSAQICENEKQLDIIKTFKSTLYERFMNDFISKEDFKYMKEDYDAEYRKFADANVTLNQKLRNAQNNTGQRLKWIEHFKKYSELEVLNRKVVIQLIRSIRVVTKTELDIAFNFADEYGMAVTFYPELMNKGVI